MDTLLASWSDLFTWLSGYLSPFLAKAPSVLALLLAAAISTAVGAVTAVSLVESRRRHDDDLRLLNGVNIAIALLVAMLGRLLTAKREAVRPAEDAAIAAATLLDSLDEAVEKNPESGEEEAPLSRQEILALIAPETWPEIDYRFALPDQTVFTGAGRQLDVVQLLTLLDFSLAELSHLVRQRNEAVFLLPDAGNSANDENQETERALRHYIRLTRDIARLTDENLFFIDKAVLRLQSLARKSLPRRLHSRIADVGLREDTGPLMPPKDMIKTFE